MKRIFSVLFALFMVIGCASLGGVFLTGCGKQKTETKGDNFVSAAASGNWSSYYASSYAGGSGTSSSPYLISTAAQLARVAFRVNSGYETSSYFKLTNDIDLSAHYWTSIGTGKKTFNGHFDGQYKTITGLTTNAYTIDDYCVEGLFGRSENATIENFSLSKAKLTSNAPSNATIWAGFVCGYVAGGNLRNIRVENSNMSPTVNSVSYCFLGGIAGVSASNALIEKCCVIDSTINGGSASSTVSNNSAVGGIVGSSKSTIKDCFFRGHIDVYCCKFGGGIVGWASDEGVTSIYSCYYVDTGTAYLGNLISGGIIGVYSSNSGGNIKSCFVDATISNNYTYMNTPPSGTKYLGSIVGQQTSGNIYYSCWYNGKAPNTAYGSKTGGTITGCSGYSSQGLPKSDITGSFYRSSSYLNGTGTNGSEWKTTTWMYDPSQNNGYPVLCAGVYTLTYNANGGSVSPTSKSITYASTYGSLATPSRTGYSFDGWVQDLATAADFVEFSGVNEGNGDFISHNGYWSHSNLINFQNTSGGSVTINTNYSICGIYAYGSSGNFLQRCGNYTSTFTIPNGTYYIRIEVNNSDLSFANRSMLRAWCTSKKITSSSIVNIKHNHSLMALWSAKSFILYLDANGGSSTKSYTVYYGSPSYSSVANYLPTRNGYTFTGFTNSSSGGTYVYDANGRYTGNYVSAWGNYLFGSGGTLSFDGTNGQTIYIYAQWTPNTYNVTFNANGGTVYAPLETWTFSGGATYNSSTGEVYFPGAGAQVTSPLIYVGDTNVNNCKSIQVRADFKMTQTNAGGPFAGITYYNAALSGYSGNGWAAKAQGENYDANVWVNTGPTWWGGEYVGADVCSYIQINIAYSSEWSSNAFYCKNVSIWIPDSPNDEYVTAKNVTYNSTYGTLPTPTRTNYTFDGWRRNVYINPDQIFETITGHFVNLRDIGVNLQEGRKYHLSFDLRLTSGVAEWEHDYMFVNYRTMPRLYSAGKTTLDNATTTWQKYESEFTFTKNNGTYDVLYDKDILHIYLKGELNRQIRNLVILEEVETTSTTTMDLAYDHTMYAKWTPTSVTHSVNLRVISPDGKSVTETTLGGTVKVEGYQISGASSSFKTLANNQTTISASYNVHQGQQFKLTATPNQGYVFAGFSTSSSASASNKMPSSSLSKTATYTPTSGTSYYVYFKQVSPNQLKYDETDKYFYFEDGYYPQSEATNQELQINDKSGSIISYDSHTKVISISASSMFSGGDIQVWEPGKDIDPFVAGQIYEIKLKHISGAGVTDNRGNLLFQTLDNDGRLIQSVSFLSSNTSLSATLIINSEELAGKKLRLSYGGGGWSCNGVYEISVQRSILKELEVGQEDCLTEEKFTYNDGSQNVDIPVYTYNNEKYVKVTKGSESKWFKFEPIRWRISDYGVEKTETNYIKYEALRKYTGYATNFTAVSDLILGVGAMHNTREVREGTSVTSMKGFQLVEETTDGCSITFQYAKSGNVIKVDNYSTSTQNNAVSTGTTAYSAPMRIASLEEITSLGLVNKGARASDMVAFILGQDKNNVTYWTRDLSNLGSGVAITSTGTKVQTWLNQLQGMRFAYTFSEGSNAGRGSLEYDTINYIQSTGTQYIDTGVTDIEGITCEFKANWQSYGKVVGQCELEAPYGRNSAYLTSMNNWMLDYGDFNPTFGSAALNNDYLVKYCTNIGNAYIDVDGNRLGESRNETTLSPSNLWIFTTKYDLNLNSLTEAKLYSCKIWGHQGNLLRDFIPVRNVYTGEVGLLDKVSGQFFGNSGTGNFVAG